MNALRQTNTFVSGMNMDLDYSVIKDNQYPYSENVRILTHDNGTTGVAQNIEGFLKVNPSRNLSGETIIHVDTIRDIAIVFTKVNSSDDFNIYKYDFSLSETEPKVSIVASNLKLDIPITNGVSPISSVCRWESDDLIKIYWCDGKHPIRMLNVATTHTNISTESLSILPKVTLPPLFFKGIGSGALLAGKYQYCYQLFNSRGSETSASVLSPIIFVTKGSSNSDSQDVIGSSNKENTSKSIILETTLSSRDFDRAKIISLYYSNNTEVPTITVIDDIPVSGNLIHYEDKGGSILTELTVDEFNSLLSYSFTPKILEAKDNMLFAANITEDTWDVSDDEFDARAYRCNDSGEVLLLSNSGQESKTFNIADIDTYEVPIDHDCICPYNYDSLSPYCRVPTSTGTYVYGGKGKNIEYRFVVTDLIEDSTSALANGLITEDYSMSSKAVTTNSLEMYGVEYNGVKTSLGNIPLSSTKSRILNYADSEIESLVRSHCRDEIYRFAIVLYNDSNLPSSAHWIGDIRMPEIGAPGFQTFTSGKQVVLGNSTTENKQLVTHPLGIQFTVKNLPPSVKAYEIVRCERTVSDRSVLMQGIVSEVIDHGSSNNMLVALPYLTYSTVHGVISRTSKYAYEWQFSNNISNEYFIFVSPEICINRENASDIIDRTTSIKSVGRLRSTINPTIGDGMRTASGNGIGGSKVKPFANAKQIKANGIDLAPVENLDYNVDNGWTYESFASGVYKNMIRMDGGDFYGTTLAKYFKYTSLISGGEANVDNIKIANNMDPFDLHNEQWKTKGTNIGEKTYYNWMWDSKDTDVTEDANNLRKQGPHGVCAVFRSKNMWNNITPVGMFPDATPGPADVNTVALCNLKQSVTPYGGNSYSARQNSVYIPTGTYQKITDNTQYTNYCFGGDTYIGVLDYANGTFAYVADDYQYNRTNRIYSGAYIPLESSINLSLRNDTFSTSKTYDSATGYSNHFVENDIIQVGNYYSQSAPLYAYNDAYSAQPRAKKFVSKSIYSIDNLTTDVRVLNSQPKTNNEVSDSWTKFKVANYIDVDSRFGAITDLKLFKNNLLFWQDDAFGTLAINERSLITDNNIGSLTLGTGGILTRYDYITTKNGLKQDHLRNVTQSDGAVYWYDYDRNEICGFDGSLQTVSKLKGVQSYLNKNRDSFRISPQSVYDKKYNEVLFTLEDKVLVFNEQLGAMTSFYTFNPDVYVEFTDKLYTFKDLKLYKYNSGDDLGLYSDKDKVAYLKLIVNKDYPQTKTFDNVEYSGEFKYPSNFDNVYFETKRQTSYTLGQDDVDYREDTYKFAIPRNSVELNEAEQLANKSYKDRMKGKYLVCHYKYDSNKGNTFQVPYISTAYRYSFI